MIFLLLSCSSFGEVFRAFHLWGYNRKQIEEHHIEHSNIYFILDESNFIINVGRYRDLNKHLLRYSNNQPLWKLPYEGGKLPFASSKYMVFERLSDSLIQIIDLDKGEIIWTWDITEKHAYTTVGRHKKGHLNDRVILWQDRFIMPVGGPSGGPLPLYALHKDTGEIIWQINRKTSISPVIYNGRLVAPNFKNIQEYDLATGELIRAEPMPTAETHKRLAWRGCIDDDKIFLHTLKPDYQIVIIDYNTLEILDEYHLEKTSPESWQLGDMKVSDGRIYIKEYMDRGGTVHVLEY